MNQAKATAKAKANTSRWQVILQDTAIFPEGGGQPSDTGSLQFADDTGSTEVHATSLPCLANSAQPPYLASNCLCEQGKEYHLNNPSNTSESDFSDTFIC